MAAWELKKTNYLAIYPTICLDAYKSSVVPWRSREVESFRRHIYLHFSLLQQSPQTEAHASSSKVRCMRSIRVNSLRSHSDSC